MTAAPVRIVDDGELSDVREALISLGVRFEEGPSGSEGEIPLLVTSAAHARQVCTGPDALHHHLHLVVSDDDDAEALRGIPCDFLLRRPVTREVLRLLAARACYTGPERRRMTRVAMGAPVTVHEGGRSREAVLAQLSIGGCGLITKTPYDEGTEIAVELPRELTRPRRLRIPGRVLSGRAARSSDGSTYDVSVVFEPLRLSDRVTLRAVMAGQPIDFRPAADAKPPRSRAPRRGARRRPVAGRFGVARVVIGRDLSPDGMRIELDPSLSEGDSLDLALYGSGSNDAVVLHGIAERDPAEEAWRVRFDGVGDDAARGIARLREACDDDGTGFVIAEILEG